MRSTRVKEGLSIRVSSLSGISVARPPLGVAYCMAKPGLALIQRQPEDFATSSASAEGI